VFRDKNGHIPLMLGKLLDKKSKTINQSEQYTRAGHIAQGNTEEAGHGV